MIDSNQKRAYPSKEIREELKKLLLVLTGAIVFSFLMGILASVIVNYSVLNVYNHRQLFLFLLPILVAAAIIAYILYYYYVFIPYSRINKDMRGSIIYDRGDGESIVDPFDGYYPQQMAWQAFEKFKNKFPGMAKERISDGVSFPSYAAKKHIFTELLEYMIVLWLSTEVNGFGENRPEPEKTMKKLPLELEKNTFISFFRELEPVDRSMRVLKLSLPKDIEVKYWPEPIKDREPDPNTFTIGLVGKYSKIYLTFFSSVQPIYTMSCGPAPVFEGVYIRQYWQNKLEEKLGRLWRFTFHINIEAKFKLRFGLFPNFSYMDWADNWINRFAKGGFFGGFDFNEFRKSKFDSMLYDIYETVKETNVSVKGMKNI